jgi:hypothetical protein
VLSYFVENDGPEAVRIHFLGGRFGPGIRKMRESLAACRK